MHDIFYQMFYEIEKDRDLVLVSIVEDAGSAPRGTGSQMLVNENGRIIGTIGGGSIEKTSEKLAIEILTTKKSKIHQFHLNTLDQDALNMVCGGNAKVFFQYIAPDDIIWVNIASEILTSFRENKEVWLIQNLKGQAPFLINKNKEILAGRISEKIDLKELLQAKSILTDDHFSMPLPIMERAIIFGAGHIAQALTPILSMVDFRVTVFDNREEFARKEIFPAAEEVILGDFTKISEHIDLEPKDYCVVLTSGHSFDFEVENQILRKDLAYVGVIGSKGKTAFINNLLMEQGISEERLQDVYTPIGTKIKAVTPEEIAVSIAGEMILKRANYKEIIKNLD